MHCTVILKNKIWNRSLCVYATDVNSLFYYKSSFNKRGLFQIKYIEKQICVQLSTLCHLSLLREGFKKSDFYHFGVWPPPRKWSFFWQLDQFLSIFEKKCIFPFENPKTLCKMTSALRVMLAATHLMFSKDQRGPHPTPILEKTCVLKWFLGH